MDIPTLITPDDTVVQDSTEIIDLLEQRFPQSPVHPATPWQRIVACLLELCGDEWLIMTAIHYRWTKPENREFALAEFGRQARPNGTPEEQREAGLEKAPASSEVGSGCSGSMTLQVPPSRKHMKSFLLRSRHIFATMTSC